MNIRPTISDTEYINIAKGEWDGRKATLKKNWKGKFVIVAMSDKSLPNGKSVTIPDHTINVGRYKMTSSLGSNKAMRCAPTLYKTKDAAERALLAFFDESSVGSWCGVKLDMKHPFETTRKGWRETDKPFHMFELFKIDDYIPDGPRDSFQRVLDTWWKSTEGWKFKHDNKVDILAKEAAKERAKERAKHVRETFKRIEQMDPEAAKHEVSKLFEIEEKRDRRSKMFQSKLNVRFVIREERSQQYLFIPENGTGFMLVKNLKDSTYFRNMHDANEVALSIDRASFVSEYATWRLKVHTVTFKNPKFNSNANADEGED